MWKKWWLGFVWQIDNVLLKNVFLSRAIPADCGDISRKKIRERNWEVMIICYTRNWFWKPRGSDLFRLIRSSPECLRSRRKITKRNLSKRVSACCLTFYESVITYWNTISSPVRYLRWDKRWELHSRPTARRTFRNPSAGLVSSQSQKGERD